MLPTARAGFWAGLVGGVITAAAIYLGLFTGGVPAVAIGLWERSLRLIPLELFSFLIVRLKFAAKPAAFWGMLATLAVVCGLVGATIARWFSPGRVVATALKAWLVASGLLTLLALSPAFAYFSAFLTAEGDEVAPLSIFVRLLTAILGYGLLFAVPYAVLARVLQRDVTPGSAPMDRMTRREVLSRALVFVAASAAGTLAARWLEGASQRAVALAQSLFARIRELPSEITPNEHFYIVSKNPPGFDPTLDVRKWSLEVGGLVARPTRFTFEELRAMPAVEQVQTLECISNEVGGDLISTARWRGVRLRDVLLRCGGPSPTALRVAFRCADGYSEAHPIDDAMNPTTLLAYEMNGEPLPKAHGYPLRLLVPGLYGMKNPKWITKIEVVNSDFQGYWEASGWSDEAVVKTMSKFTTNAPTYHLGEVDLGGVAYGGDRSIKDVEYSVDGGKTWQKVALKPPLGLFTWVLWAALWKPAAPGEYVLKVRARDGNGILQISKETPTLPDGASGYHTLRVRIVK